MARMTRSNQHRIFPMLVVGLLLLRPIFWQTLPDLMTAAAFMLGLALVGFWFVINRRWTQLRLGWSGVSWLLLAIFAGASHVALTPNLSASVLFLVTAVLVMLLSSTSSEWIASAFTVLLVFVAVHAAATIFFYFFPGSYPGLVKTRFFPDDYGATGYKSALTSHFSYNALYCTLGFLIAGSRVLYAPSPRRHVWAGWGLTAFFLLALVLTAKRGQFLFGVLALVLLYLCSNANGKFLKITAVGVIFVAGLLWLSTVSTGINTLISRLSATLENTDIRQATSGRNLLWEYALDGWSEHPVLGNGWHSFHFFWPEGSRESFHSHNQLLNLLYETGLIGLTLFLCAAITSTVLAVKTLRRTLTVTEQTGALQQNAAAALAIQLFLLIYACTTGELLNSHYSFVPYFLAVAASLAYQRELHEHDGADASQAPAFPVARLRRGRLSSA